MTSTKLIFRNLIFHWRTNLPIVAGVAAAVTVLSGALIVGQSVKASLRRLLFERIGATEYVVSGNRFFSEKLASLLGDSSAVCPIVSIKGVLTNEKSGISVHNVNVYGVDRRFWTFHKLEIPDFPQGRGALLGETLAHELDARPGDPLLLKIEKQQEIPREWLLGRRDDIAKTIRMSCQATLAADRLGEFALRPHQGKIYSIFVPLNLLQKEIGQPGRANTLLLSAHLSADSIAETLAKNLSLDDLGLRLRSSPSRTSFSLESSQIILDENIAQAAMRAAEESGMAFSPIYTYLANTIRYRNKEIPYSLIAAVDLGEGAMTPGQGIKITPVQRPNFPAHESIWITDWVHQHLGVSQGEPIEIDYYLWQDEGRLVTRTAQFRAAGVVSIAGGIDSSLTPEVPGITQARSLSSWDPPFPLDLKRIRRVDEDYWDRYKTTPKAFITLARGQELWANRFGRLTGVRISPRPETDLESAQKQWASVFATKLDWRQAGLKLEAVREKGLAASQGSTDFGQYFAYFNSFLIAAALLLAASFFRLMIEQRVREIGILRTAGFTAGMLFRLFIIEGFILTLAGSLLGSLGSLAYAGIIMFGIRSFWSGTLGMQRFFLHASGYELAAGALAGMSFSLVSIAWSLRGLRRSSTRSLLAGILESTELRKKKSRSLGLIAVLASLAALALIAASLIGKLSSFEGFFAAGFLTLTAILSASGAYLRSGHPSLIRGKLRPAFLRFAVKNATHRPGRSLLCASLIACAAFIIVSMQAFRRDPARVSLEQKSGTGGYTLIAETVMPFLYDPNSEAGQEVSGLSAMELPELRQARFVPFRERPADDASCLNLYAPQEPTILGAPQSFISAGRFSFHKSLAKSPEEKSNPWLLLNSSAYQPAVPAIADANTIQYIFHLSVGSELTVRDRSGNPIRLLLVASLQDSIFQGALLISESNFLRLFPEQQGYRFFLLEAPPTAATALIGPIKQAMADYGITLQLSRERLEAFQRVQNTYLSTFQALGLLGMILGTVGLAAVLLRNVLERRKELALMQAVGFRKRLIAAMVLSENVLVMLWGLASGTVCALLAILPGLMAQGQSLPLLMIGLVLLSVFVAGTLSSILALAAAFRSPLLAALHSE